MAHPTIRPRRLRGKVRSSLRRSSLVLLGAVAGATLSLLATQPNLMSAKARPVDIASASDPYRELERFGKVFELVRAGYVDKTDDGKLIDSAINGMLTGLDPHSSYMDAKSYREMQTDTVGEFGGLGMEVTMEDGLIKVVDSDRRHPRRQGRHPGQRRDHHARQRAGAGPHAPAGRRPDARADRLRPSSSRFRAKVRTNPSS